MRQLELYIAAQADVSETDASADPCRLRQRPARAAMTIHVNVTSKEWGGDWLAPIIVLRLRVSVADTQARSIVVVLVGPSVGRAAHFAPDNSVGIAPRWAWLPIDLSPRCD